MSKFMLGYKAGMTQIFNEDGIAIPVTVIQCGPIHVMASKTPATDGYSAVQVAFDDVKPSRVNRPETGQFEKAGVSPKRHVREFRVSDNAEFAPGQRINVSEMFAVGDRVDVTGTSKGKGFQGAIKRHGQRIGRRSHGSKYHRRVGSMGASATPSRVMKGKKMPGQMGNERVTVQNLDVVMVDGERNILVLKGAVPGIKGGCLAIKQTVKSAK